MKKTLGEIFTPEIVTNILVTFVQAGLAAWAVTNYQFDKVAIAGAVGAGLSAVWNLVIKPRINKTVK